MQGKNPGSLSGVSATQTKLCKTPTGGVGLTMVLVRQKYWTLRLRQLTNNVINLCYGCKKLLVTMFPWPQLADLPVDRTKGSYPFQVTGVDFAGPKAYKASKKKEGKHIYSCSQVV